MLKVADEGHSDRKYTKIDGHYQRKSLYYLTKGTRKARLFEKGEPAWQRVRCSGKASKTRSVYRTGHSILRYRLHHARPKTHFQPGRRVRCQRKEAPIRITANAQSNKARPRRLRRGRIVKLISTCHRGTYGG